MEVYKVAMKAVADDYHENVNADVFIKRFKNLLDLSDATGQKYLIVSLESSLFCFWQLTSSPIVILIRTSEDGAKCGFKRQYLKDEV